MSPELLLLISVAIVILPLLAVILSHVLAKILNCEISEADAKCCFLFGYDIGNILYALNVCGWLIPLTVPVAALGFFISFAWFLIRLI